MRLRLVASLVALVLTGGAPAGATTASVGPDGNLLVDGAPFFPIGIYHVSWIGDRQGVKAAPDLELAADAGFNLMHATVDARDDMQDLFDAAVARGVYLIGETPWPASGPDAFVNKWKSHPALIGWSIADDFNAPYSGPAYNHPPAEVGARNAYLHGLVPTHLSYASGGSYPGFRIAEFLVLMDVMGFQSYPLGAGNSPDDYALQENVDSFDWVADQLAGSGQLFVANPQAYRWTNSRYPTPREARNFLYAPLLRGAKGILWYAMWEGSARYLPGAAPALWQDLKSQNVELASLTSFLLHGARTELPTANARVRAASWELAGQVVVVALSTERSASHAVALALPANATGPAHRLFPGRAEAGMSVSGSQLVGSIGPEEVHVYLLDLAPPGNARPTAALTVVPPTVAFGSAATLDGSSSSDADGSVVAWEWDVGDGTLASGTSVAHTWALPGTYWVRLTVRDDDGATGTTIVPVDVGITALCPPAPSAGCRAAGRSIFTIRDPGVPSRRTLVWSWKRAGTDLGDFGHPTSSTEYALCVYDAGGRAIATGVPPGAGWTSLGAAGFRLRDPAADPGGLTQARLKPGTSPAASLTVKGKGVHLPALALPLALPVTAQLVSSDGGVCWEGVYTAGPTTRTLPELFKGRDG
jgi:PKD domain